MLVNVLLISSQQTAISHFTTLFKGFPSGFILHTVPTQEAAIQRLFYQQSDIVFYVWEDQQGIKSVSELHHFVRHIPILLVADQVSLEDKISLKDQGVYEIITLDMLNAQWIQPLTQMAIRFNKAHYESVQLREKYRCLKREIDQQIEHKTERLTESIAEMEQHLKVKTKFLSSISQEIKQPITLINQLVQAIASHTVPEPLMPFLKKLELNTQRVLNFFESVLELTLLKTEQVELVPTAFLLDRLVSDLLVHVKKNINEETMQFKAILCAHIQKTVVVDHYYLYKLLRNLLDGAIKNCSEGLLTLSFDILPIAIAKLQLQVTISYFGSGPTRDELRAFHEDYTKVDSLKPEYFKGSGTHLALSSLIAKTLGARLSFEQTGDDLNIWSMMLDLPMETSFVHTASTDYDSLKS